MLPPSGRTRVERLKFLELLERESRTPARRTRGFLRKAADHVVERGDAIDHAACKRFLGAIDAALAEGFFAIGLAGLATTGNRLDEIDAGLVDARLQEHGATG